ncbi:MAG: hypothetical protein K6T66_12945 [Peptococcaceae bacterium]|nr:hypothetical protein [Peptococcaceae bacterium]
MNGFPVIQIYRKRKEMRLSQRKAASLIAKMYGVKLSHSYLSLIERGRVDSIGDDLKNALADFFKIGPEENEAASLKETSTRAHGTAVHRIPLYGKARVEGYLDMAGPQLADFAVRASSDRPEMGIFCGDILACRKAKPLAGDLAVAGKKGVITYFFYDGQDLTDILGTVVLILKKSLNAEYHKASLNAAASALSEDQLARELASKTGLKLIDILRSLALLKEFSINNGQGKADNEKNN